MADSSKTAEIAFIVSSDVTKFNYRAKSEIWVLIIQVQSVSIFEALVGPID